MKRPRIGDVYWIKVPNGYKLYQWAYSIPRKGHYIRVFQALYEAIPLDVESIVNGPHSYIIPFNSNKAYRVGLAHLIDNFPVPDQYPFPEYKIGIFCNVKGLISHIEVSNTDDTLRDSQLYAVSCIAELPAKYQNVTLLNHYITPNWMLFLFDNGFNLSNLEAFFPGLPGEDYDLKLQVYTDMVEKALESSK